MFIPIITDLVNKSLATGLFPTPFKQALVRPLTKKATLDKDIYKNYRPVSNLPYVSKLLEKVVAERLKVHIDKNGLNEVLQSAYKSGHSTETALLRVQNDILRAVDNGQGVFLILLDLSAAFDTIDHSILLNILEDDLGLHSTVLEWFRSYLSERSQSISIDGVLSALIFLLYGVPQGSVLGPILFCIYTLKLGMIIRKYGLTFHIYADDTQIYASFSITSKDELLRVLANVVACIQEIKSWMSKCKLKLNGEKTEFMVITSPYYRNVVKQVSLNISDVDIMQAQRVRNLGVMFDTVMNMRPQITNICKCANYYLRCIGSVRKYLTDDSAALLIHSFVSSRLDYCNSLLAGLPDGDYAKLQKVHNTAARIVTRTLKFDHITPVLIELHWLPIPLRIVFKILLMVFKALNNMAPMYIRELLTNYVPVRNLRSSHQGQLVQPKVHLKTYGERAFSTVAPRLWNELPMEVTILKDIDAFKCALKTHLFRKFIANPSVVIKK